MCAGLSELTLKFYVSINRKVTLLLLKDPSNFLWIHIHSDKYSKGIPEITESNLL